MRIGIDIRKVFDSGIGTYIRNLLDEFQGDEYAHEFVLLASPGDIEKLHAGGIARTPKFQFVTCRAGKYSIGEMWSLAQQVNALHLDVYHAPHFTLPFGIKARKIVTIHDLIPLRFPEYFAWHKRLYGRFVIGHACRSADVIMTVSHFSRNDILSLFQVPQGRVRVAYHGAAAGFRPCSPDRRFALREKLRLPGRYAFYAGNFKPHKNIPLALRAFAAVPSAEIEHLVLAGGDPEELRGLQDLAISLGIAGRVKFVGKLPFEDLVAAYNEAFAVVLPSRYEGFGFPVLEAMACGAPVICADAASLPEVAGDAALLFASGDADALAGCLRRLAMEPGLRKDLIERGFARVKQFSPAVTARLTMDAYEGLPYHGE